MFQRSNTAGRFDVKLCPHCIGNIFLSEAHVSNNIGPIQVNISIQLNTSDGFQNLFMGF